MSKLTIEHFIADGMNRELKDPACVVLYLSLHALKGSQKGAVVASLQRLADVSGVSKSTVQRAMKTLEETGYVSKSMDSPTAEPSWKLLMPKRR